MEYIELSTNRLVNTEHINKSTKAYVYDPKHLDIETSISRNVYVPGPKTLPAEKMTI